MEKAPDPSEKGDLAKKALQAIRNGNGEELLKLLLAGADPNAAPTSGIKNGASNTLLYHAVAKQDASLVNILLDQGANANGSKADGFPPLQAAVIRNNAALITLLLLRGADVNRRYTIVSGNHKGTKTVLFEAATSNTYELLLKNGANLHAKNSWHETPLHFQAYNWSSRLVHVLVSSGADVNAVNKKNTTPLDNAIFRKPSQRKSDDEEFLEVCRILLRNKAVVSWSDPDLYFQSKGKSDVEPNTIKARLQLVHEWNSLRSEGSTSFKLPIEVFRRGALDITTYYTALNRGGRGRDSIKPKKTKVIGGGQYERSQREGEIIKGGDSFLIAAPMTRQDGSPLTSACKPSAWDIADSSSDPSSDSELRRVSGSDNTSVGQEVQSKIAGDGCVNPERSQRVFSNRPEAENPLYRCKVCVVGPSRWGKTSFIKSFTSGTPTLESMDIRTIGIDLFPWSFDVETEAGDCEYQVSFWDFAGQEEYRAAHTLFYSSRTLYLLCINLDRYHNALTAASDSMDQTVDDRMMDAFADINVFRWVRMICAHHPQAEFVFLGTKADLLQHDRHKIIAVQQDIVARFNSNVRRMKDRVQRALQELEDARFEIQDNDAGAETPELDDQIAGCEQILRKQPGLLSEELIVFSSADLKDESIARGKLKALLMMSGSSVLLPPSYAELLKHAQQRYMSGQKHLPSFQDKVDTAFVSVSEFIESVTCASKLIIPEKEMLSALHLLHDTGDIVWFDGVSDARLLQERLFLDPMLVIEFIRQIVNHKVDAKASVNGYVSHSQLQSLPFWKDVSSSTIQQLKELLLHLNLAYSAGKSKKMVWNSDLIIPVYWNRSPGPTSSTDVKTFSTEEEKSVGLVECVRWEYSFEPAIPENLYEKLAVATYSPLLRSERKYGGSSFIDKVVDEYSARVAKEEDTSNFSAQEVVDAIVSVLSVSVAAQDRTLAWKQLVWYCMNLESLLKTYPGLLVTRCTVNQRGQRFNVDQLLSDQEHFMQLNICTDQEFLPADMDWYTNRHRHQKLATDTSKALVGPSEKAQAAEMALLRQDIYKLSTTVEKHSDDMDRQFQLNGEHIDAAVDALKRSQISLITGMQNKAKFPSLWTLEYQGFDSEGSMASSFVTSLQRKVTTTVIVKFRSELSGKCYHDPIAIPAAREVFSRFGKFLKVGLTLLSAAAPDFCGKDVLGIITDECKRQIDRSTEFHEVLHRAGISDDRAVRSQQMETNRDLSPYEVLTLLNCLLRLHNQDFQPDDISQLSGLVCGVVVQTNEYIWASRNEILQHGKDIVLAVDYSKRPTKDNASTEEKAALGTLPTVEILPPILTETLSQLVPAPTERDSSIISSAKADSPEDSVASKGMLQAMRRRLSSSKAAVPTAEVQRFMLMIIGAKGLHGRRKQSPYCICRFESPSGKLGGV
ncbi:hypothetical protein KRP22_009234 [Phytophthora ramorum]|nr:putative ankyrin repeat protein [Phytophthora ramorum]